MNRMNGLLAATFLSVALLVSTMASAVPLRVFESTRSDPAKQTHIFNDAFATAVARTITQLRAATFADGKEKSAQRIALDRQKAGRVEQIAAHLTDKQAGDLVTMIASRVTAAWRASQRHHPRARGARSARTAGAPRRWGGQEPVCTTITGGGRPRQGVPPASNALRALIEEIDAVWGRIMTAMSTGVRFTALYAAWLVASLTEIRDVISDQDEIILSVRRAAPERT